MAPRRVESNVTSRVAYARGDGCLVALEGTLDETFNPSVFSKLDRSVALLDLDRLERASSFGVGKWVASLPELQVTYLGLMRARPPLVYNFNTVHGFSGQGELLSLYAPYACAQCGHEFDVLFDVGLTYQRAPNPGAPPPMPCESCGKPARFDDLPDYFFSFALENPPRPPAGLAQFLAGYIDLGYPLWASAPPAGP